jgi:acetolactate decarboxylase
MKSNYPPSAFRQSSKQAPLPIDLASCPQRGTLSASRGWVVTIKTNLLPCFLAVFTVALLGCTVRPAPTLVQVSTMDALLGGDYHGKMPVADLLGYGDLGLGTFDRLDGEMVVEQGLVWQIKSDGSVGQASAQQLVPYAAVIKFKAERAAAISTPVELAAFQALINGLVSDQRKFCAFRFKGRFSALTTRSVPAQREPYPPLMKVINEEQVTFELKNVKGTLVGFRSPAEMKGVGVPGYHMHFISDDRLNGGHILKATLESGILEWALTDRFLLILPESSERQRDTHKTNKMADTVAY